MQTFAAKVAVDFGPGGGLGNTMNALLGHMQQDLTGIGQFFGNLGHLLAWPRQCRGWRRSCSAGWSA